MARKKRKAGKERGEPLPVLRRADSRLLPGFGALALVLSWLAALGGISDGTMDLRYVFNNDTIWPYGMFRDAVLDDGYPVSGWGIGPAAYYFPDHALLWPLFALFGMAAGTYVFSLLQVFLAAVGWILVCDRMFGKNPLRRCVVFLLHAATYLLFAWRESGLFMLQMTGVWHWGAWACMPWLLWLSMRTLEVPAPANIAALVLAVAVAVPSDLVLAPWFVGPAAAAAALSARPKSAGIFAAALAGGMALGWAVHAALEPVDNPKVNYGGMLNAEHFGRNLQTMLKYLGELAKRDPAEFLLIPAFAAAALWRAAGEFSARKEKEARGKTFHLRRFVLFFVPLSIAGAAGGGVLKQIGVLGYYHPIQDLRYVLPIVLFPLFVGWALLDFPKAKFPPRRAAFAVCAFAVLLAAPKMARIDFAALDPFATPFQKCFAENAKKRGWTGALAPGFYVLSVFLNPDAEQEHYINMWAPYGNPVGERRYQANKFIANWHRASGPFQVVVATAHQGRLFGRPPRAQDAGCSFSDPLCLQTYANDGIPPHDSVIRAAFGEPSEVLECAGVGLYEYNPPLRFDFPEIFRQEEALGRKF